MKKSRRRRFRICGKALKRAIEKFDLIVVGRRGIGAVHAYLMAVYVIKSAMTRLLAYSL